MKTKKFFSYAPDGGIQFHHSAEEANIAAEISLNMYVSDGVPDNWWKDRANDVIWGEVRQMTIKSDTDIYQLRNV